MQDTGNNSKPEIIPVRKTSIFSGRMMPQLVQKIGRPVLCVFFMPQLVHLHAWPGRPKQNYR